MKMPMNLKSKIQNLRSGMYRRFLVQGGILLAIVFFGYLAWRSISRPRVEEGFGELPKVVEISAPSAWTTVLPDSSSVYKMVGPVSPDVDTDRLPVYQVESGLSAGSVKSLARRLGFGGEPKVITTRGPHRYTWVASDNSRLESVPKTGFMSYKVGAEGGSLVLGGLPEKDKLREYAVRHLQDLGLVAGEKDVDVSKVRYLGGEDHLIEVSSPEEALLGEACFTFTLPVERKVVFGEYSDCPISVWVGSGNQLLRVLWNVPYQKIAEQSVYRVKKLDQAWRELTQGQGYVAYLSGGKPGAIKDTWGEAYAFRPDDFESVTIEQAKLAYLMDVSKSPYLQPIWVFTGQVKVGQYDDPLHVILYLQAV